MIANDKPRAVKIGDKAPEFSLPAQDGTVFALEDFLGKKSVVLFFYPKDNTLVCTKEVCSFRDSYAEFTQLGAEVIGISSDSQDSHKGFATQNRLPYKLLSDEHGTIRKLYGVPSTMGILPGRVTYVIDKQGVVRLIFNSQLDAEKHVQQTLRVLKNFHSASPKN